MTKYLRQIARARALIKKKGTTCTWYKADNTDTSDDTSPEFPNNDAPTVFNDVPIAFYPANRQNLYTALVEKITGQNTNQLFAVIPGDVPFKPEPNDAVLCNGEHLNVDTVNTTKPDGTAIIHEVSFQ